MRAMLTFVGYIGIAVLGIVTAAPALHAQQLGLGNQEMPAYTPYSPTMPNYHRAPVIGGWAPDQSPSYQPATPGYQPPAAYPQYLPSCRDPMTGTTVPCR